MAKSKKKQEILPTFQLTALQSPPKSFPHIDALFSNFALPDFRKLTLRKRFKKINETLLQLITDSPKDSFLLAEVVDFIDRVNQQNLLNVSTFHISSFEFWLNNFSALSPEENYFVRAKIVGKFIPREEYQAYFPVGMNTRYFGSHFICAHFSPDIDTMIASFWGWVDAFAAQVGTGQHLWSLPGGPPSSPVTKVFQQLFGLSVFNGIAHSAKTLVLTAQDLVTQKNFFKKTASTNLNSIDGNQDSVTVQVDDEGCFLGDWHHTITLSSDVDTIRKKIEERGYLTVVIPEGEDKLFPVGVVRATDLRKPQLGTVSFRDFCNEDEVHMAPYLRPISVIDHHKTSFKTSTPPFALIGDVQSCNVLIAEQTMRLNDRYSQGGMTIKEIEAKIESISQQTASLKNMRLLKRLLQYRMNSQTRGSYFVHPERELSEYLCFMYAILDDTDLLTKMSTRDIECVVELINRILSLSTQDATKEVDIDHIPRDKDFVQNASKHILQTPPMYALYRTIYESKEQEIDAFFKLRNKEDYLNLFLDTKEQNGCCVIGQTKMFSSNYKTFKTNRLKLLQHWLKQSQEIYEERTVIDFYLQMMSTIASAEDVYEDKVGLYSHQDEIWIWVPASQKAYNHLESFLSAFQSSPGLQNNQMTAYLPLGHEALKQIFIQNFSAIAIVEEKAAAEDLPIVILRFNAGSLNSRKAMITPFLPQVIL